MRNFAFLIAMTIIISSISTFSLPVSASVQSETKTESAESQETPADESTDTQAPPGTEESTPTTNTQGDADGAATAEENELAAPLDISQGSVPFEADIDPNVAAYMVELKTGTIIHARNQDKKMYPASLTKIMTAILVLENIPDLSTKITFKSSLQNMMYEINISTPGGISTGGLVAGEELTVEELLYGLMLPSANEIAVMFADYIGGGSLDKFYEMMNQKATELGCKNTHFVNANGLHDTNHYTTAYDMYLITRHALENEKFREIVSTTQYDTGKTNKHDNLRFINTNRMLSTSSSFYLPEVSGVKTGSTDEAGRCLASVAQKNGYEYVLVLMGAPYSDSNSSFSLSYQFYDWAFDNYRAKTIVEKGDRCSSINKVRLAKKGSPNHLQLMSGQTFTALLPKNIDVSNVRRIAYDTKGNRISDENYITAPVEKGMPLGELHLMLYGSVLGKVDLLAAETIEASPTLVTLDKIGEFFSSSIVKFTFLFLIVFIVLYTLVMILRNHNRKKYKRVAKRRKL